MNNIVKVKKEFQGTLLTLETGHLAKQAGGSVLATWGETQVLGTSTMSHRKTDRDFFPLSVDYIEKFYANGKIPGSYTKREARPSNEEIHIARLIDRPLRPLFSNEIRNEIQVIVTVLSMDEKNSSDILALIAASASLIISDIPFEKPVGAVRVGYLEDKLIINPKANELENLSLDLIVAGTNKAITMIEGGGNEVPEDKVLTAVKEAHEVIKKIVIFQEELKAQVNKPKKEVELFELDADLKEAIRKDFFSKLENIISLKDKVERESKRAIFVDEVHTHFKESEFKVEQIPTIIYKFESEIVRKLILEKDQRADGRKMNELRDIECLLNPIIRPHGSSLFTRGETQSLGVVTIGSDKDRQKIDLTRENYFKRFLLHYNFPPFSVGEVNRLIGTSRREIGHGMLAERSLLGVLPSEDDFDFTIRFVSEVLESNGSSSMATVCSGSLALMAAGIPIKKHVAGIAMGLILEEDNYKILTDIQGMEDSLGDMDFKVAGTKEGITGFQLDIKVEGITIEIMEKALAQAKEARLTILDKMYDCISTPQEIKEGVPQRKVISIDKYKIRNLIGPGGKNIKKIVEDTGSDVSVSDDGEVKIFSPNKEILAETEDLIKKYTGSVEVGEEYDGVVKKVMNFGAFIEILPSLEGLCHISRLSKNKIDDIFSFVQEGDCFRVKVEKIDGQGKVGLARIDEK